MATRREIQHGNVRLTLPDGWRDGTQLIAVGPISGGTSPSMVVGVDVPAPSDEDAEDYANRTLAAARAVTPGLKVLKEEAATLGDLSGHWREQQIVVGKDTLAQVQFFVLRDGAAYTFTITHRADELESLRDTAAMLLKGVRLLAL